MGKKVVVHHESRYRYEHPVLLGPQTIRLRPAPHCRAPITSYSLDIKPTDSMCSWQFDPLANHVARVVFPSKTTEFAVTVDLVADMTPVNPFDFLLEPEAETVPFVYKHDVARNLEPFLSVEPAGFYLTKFVDSLRGQRPTVAFLLGLNEQIRNQVRYTTRL